MSVRRPSFSLKSGKKKKRARTHSWYIEPHGVEANRFLFGSLGEESYIGEIECSDGEKHHLYECRDSKLVRGVLKSSDFLGYELTVWRRRSKGGQVELSPFHGKNKLSSKKKKEPSAEDKPALF